MKKPTSLAPSAKLVGIANSILPSYSSGRPDNAAYVTMLATAATARASRNHSRLVAMTLPISFIRAPLMIQMGVAGQRRQPLQLNVMVFPRQRPQVATVSARRIAVPALGLMPVRSWHSKDALCRPGQPSQKSIATGGEFGSDALRGPMRLPPDHPACGLGPLARHATSHVPCDTWSPGWALVCWCWPL